MNYYGRRFVVVRSSTWFPNDFAVVGRGELPWTLRIANEGDSYIVSVDRLEAALDAGAVREADLTAERRAA